MALLVTVHMVVGPDAGVHVTLSLVLAGNPPPVIVTVAPTGALTGMTEKLGVTVNVAVAVLPPVPLAVTVWAPPTDGLGTLNEQLQAPSALVVAVHNVAPPGQVTVTVVLLPNPLPVAVTEVLTGPIAGVRTSAGVTVNDAPTMKFAAADPCDTSML
jgi:hypothetical protein